MALVCLTSLPLLMLIMGEFQFARLYAVLTRAACDSGKCMCVELPSVLDETGLTIFVSPEIRFC